jgi:hypothetical protein
MPAHLVALKQVQAFGDCLFSELAGVKSELLELLRMLVMVNLRWKLSEDLLRLRRAALFLELLFDEVSWNLHGTAIPTQPGTNLDLQ